MLRIFQVGEQIKVRRLHLTARASGLLPTVVYTIPEVSMVGETEESLERSGVSYIVGRAPYFSSARGRIIGDSDGFLKLLFRRDDLKLLGVHAIGEQATELILCGTDDVVDRFRRRSV
jgi:NAD(P) transhydrogenase